MKKAFIVFSIFLMVVLMATISKQPVYRVGTPITITLEKDIKVIGFVTNYNCLYNNCEYSISYATTTGFHTIHEYPEALLTKVNNHVSTKANP